MNARCAALAACLPSGAQAALLSSAPNIRYVSGYTGEGLALVAQDLRAIVTDFRYTEQAQRQAPDFEVFEIAPGERHEAVAYRLLQKRGVRTLAVEEDVLTVADYRELQKAMPDVSLVSLEGAPQRLRWIKDADELDMLERANRLTSDCFEHMCSFIREGMTEREIALEIDFWMMRRGSEGVSFETIVASGENGSLCHAIPSDRRVRSGDLITMDFGAVVGGYHADLTRTVALGAVSAECARMYETVLRAQLAALEAIRPGVVCSEVDAVARRIIDGAGYEGRFGHSLGHSAGLEIHENPGFSRRCQEPVAAGMVITVEPGIYVPGVGGVRIEDSVAVTQDGVRILTPASKELITL
ncbi:MAG TPA: aminopeptidase P family protein [Candidatus Onthenecus intestinigallinarum]|uniref:Aminopeptidase P family protein n=1 Tax=Candidatus Onthenecus intestinigallinarum TaxID=2840875 RepID=A0A9D0ZAR7_9FIRM|nr:aminopeptidase P family protein [Candidatus Onthenecus intestinigallinarum]